ncbi:polysaccharide lyase 8 family protein [Actinomadura namibiensis]|uniref:Hyaluronate lyase n=1 Tax=Actinomadura namibiensis TaxID=182080 RepID=A0A7W3QLR3_ACTNM|nr:polysaccharide lyase 8 family protein [Actinomadura namibiensis]MBA8951794.1 hyaluronate lyase [Actinomadura namibiensis]
MPLSRRGFLTAAAGTGATLLGGAASAAPARAADEFDVLRQRWRSLVLGAGFDAAAEPFRGRLAGLGADAADLRRSMEPAAGSLWPDLVYADPEPDTDAESVTRSAAVTGSLQRLVTMAHAWAQPGTGLTGDAALLTAATTGLDHLHTQVYRAGQARYGNWWHWQIGAPRALFDLCAILGDRLPAGLVTGLVAAVGHFVPDSAVATYGGTSTGANRVDLCRSIAFTGVVGRDAARLALARDALSPVFPHVTTGDGFYRDGSFIQHGWVPYTGTYGNELLGGLAVLFALLAGSDWAVTDPNRRLFLDSVERSYAPVLFNGLMMDGVSGRGISRGAAPGDPARARDDDHVRGHAVIANIALLAQGAPAAEAARWKGMVKGWAARDAYAPLLSDPRLGVAALARCREILDDPAVVAAAEPTGHRLFAAMDRAVHRRPGWAAMVSMSSARIAFYEHGNGENLRGWHTGAGMLYWWGADSGNGQYSDAFWPTVDPYRLPGVTVSRKALADAAGGAWGADKPNAVWVGGTTDGEFAAVGQDTRGLHSTLTARKSWFLLDDAVICLGGGVACSDGTAVESVYDNRNLGASGTHALTVDGTAQPVAHPWSATFPAPRWAHLAGFGGYVFLDGRAVVFRREERTGRWRDINTGGSTTAITRRYLTLYRHHGTDPVSGGYAYLVMPGATAAATAARAGAPWATVLANGPDRQGIAVPSLGVTAVNFFAAGSAGGVTVSAPASVLVRERGDGTAVVCVADPRRSATTIDVTWARAVASVVSRDPTVTVTGTGASLALRVNAAGSAGATHRLVVRL